MYDSESKPNTIKRDEIAEVKLVESLQEISNKVTSVCRYFFIQGLNEEQAHNAPFKGFLLQGPPGTGKTELVKQIFKKLPELPGKNIDFNIVDGSDIASARWGDAEKKLKSIFNYNESSDTANKKIILFDDIDCFMMGRSAEVAKEWHFSINAVFFHEIDKLNPSHTIVFATTNRPDLVDDALKSRLYVLDVPPPTVSSLMKVVGQMLSDTQVEGKIREKIIENVNQQLNKIKKPTIRDARQLTAVFCIENGAWSA